MVAKAISVRLDDEALKALKQLEAAGMSRSDAIRSALLAAAGRLRQRQELAAEVAALEADGVISSLPDPSQPRGNPDTIPLEEQKALGVIRDYDPDYRELRVPVTVVKRPRQRAKASPDRVELSATPGQPVPSRIVRIRAADDESVEALRAWLRSVVGGDGDVVADSVLLGRTCFELADEMGLTPATVRKRLQRALDRARRAIEGRNTRSQFPRKAAFVGR